MSSFCFWNRVLQSCRDKKLNLLCNLGRLWTCDLPVLDYLLGGNASRPQCHLTFLCITRSTDSNRKSHRGWRCKTEGRKGGEPALSAPWACKVPWWVAYSLSFMILIGVVLVFVGWAISNKAPTLQLEFSKNSQGYHRFYFYCWVYCLYEGKVERALK